MPKKHTFQSLCPPSAIYQLIGKSIADHREALDMTQDELAGILGYGVNTVARWEQSRRSIEIPKLYLIGCSLGVDPRHLLPSVSEAITAHRELLKKKS